MSMLALALGGLCLLNLAMIGVALLLRRMMLAQAEPTSAQAMNHEAHEGHEVSVVKH